MRASMRYGSASPKTSTCPTLIVVLGLVLLIFAFKSAMKWSLLTDVLIDLNT